MQKALLTLRSPTDAQQFVSSGERQHFYWQPLERGAEAVRDFKLCVQASGQAELIVILDADSLQEQNLKGSLKVEVARDGRLSMVVCSWGAPSHLLDMDIELIEPGAEVSLSALSLGFSESRSEHRLHIHHRASHTKSTQKARAILWGKAQCLFQGRVHIHENIEKVHADQICRGLLFSPSAEYAVRPELEIESDDVKATHGASLGQLDPQQIFYLMSRGVTKTKAVEVLCRGFAAEILHEISVEDVRRQLVLRSEQVLASYVSGVI